MVEEYQKKTPVFDWAIGDFAVDPQRRVMVVTEQKAVTQVVIKALQTRRAVFLIYADLENEDNNYKYGNDTVNVLTADLTDDARMSELKRAIKEALVYDPWITDVYDIVVKRLGTGDVAANFKLKTIFDREYEFEGVTVTNG